MRKLLLVFMGVLMTVSILAQEVSFHFTDGIYNAALKSRMERNASALLTEINQAAEQGRSLQLNGKVGMEAAERLDMLWENFGFVCQSNADTTPIQRQISCNIQNDKKLRVNANIYSI